jgi:hypothetical protein
MQGKDVHLFDQNRLASLVDTYVKALQQQQQNHFIGLRRI